MYKRLTSNMRPGPDLLQEVPTLVLNVDFLMIMSVKGPVGSIYCKQSMFLSLLMIFCSYTPVKCDQVLIYCRQCHSCPECWLSHDYVCQGTCVILSWIITDRDCSCPVWWYSPVQLWLTMYKWLPSTLWHGLDLLQTVTTLVLNVDLLMIFFWHVKRTVGSIYWRQRMFLSCLMIFFYNRRGTVYVQIIITDIHSHSV